MEVKQNRAEVFGLSGTAAEQSLLCGQDRNENRRGKVRIPLPSNELWSRGSYKALLLKLPPPPISPTVSNKPQIQTATHVNIQGRRTM